MKFTKPLLVAGMMFAFISCQKEETSSIDLSLNGVESSRGGTGTSVDLRKGLVAYYPFSGNAKDASGNGNDGTVDGAVLASDKNGKRNSAYYFNGVNFNKIIVYSVNPSLCLTGDFTISSWFYSNMMYDNSGTVRTIVAKMGDGVGSQNGYIFGIFGTTNTDASTGVMCFGAYPAPPSTDEDTYPRANSYVTINNWYHAAVTYTKATGEIKYYLNGILTDTRTVFYRIQDNTNPLTIGSQLSYFSTVKTFSGKIDEVRLYNRTLSQTEIVQLAK